MRTVAGAAWRIWRRQAAASLGITQRTLDLGIVIAVLLMAVLGATLSVVIVGMLDGLGALPPGADHTTFTRLTAAGAAMGAVLTQTVLAATRPASTALGDALAVLPVPRATRAAGERMPTVALGLGFALLLASPSATFLVILFQSTPDRALAAIAVTLLLTVVATLGGSACFELLYALGCVARLPHAYASATAAGAVLAATAGASLPAVVPHPGPLDLAWLVSPIEAVAQLAGGTGFGAIQLSAGASLIAWMLAVTMLTAAALRLPLSRPAEFTRLTVGIPVPRGRTASAVAAQALQLIRMPQYVVLGVLPVLLAVALATPPAQAAGTVAGTLASLPLVAPFSIAMFAFGLTHPSSWWARLLDCSRWALAAHRLVAGLLVAAVPAVVSATVLVASGALDPSIAGESLATGVVLGVAGALGGMLAPWSSTNALATTVVAAVTATVFAAAVVPVQLISAGLGAGALGVPVSAVLLLTGWFAVSRWRDDVDLVPA